jgi:hypothetical protein
MRKPQYGDHVVFIDEFRKHHNALVTAPWGETCVNLLYVSADEQKTDSYGRQIERESSCVHLTCNEAKAHCWAWPDEV